MKRGILAGLFSMTMLPCVSAQTQADIQAAILAAQAAAGNDPQLASILANAQTAGSNAVAFSGMMIAISLAIAVAAYVYIAFALMKIAKKTNTPDEWMVWVPVANLWLLNNISQTPRWSFWVATAGLALGFIPKISIVGGLMMLGVFFWWFWKICPRLGRPEWWAAVLSIPFLSQVVNYFFINIAVSGIIGIGSLASAALLGVLAWANNKSPSPPVPLVPLVPVTPGQPAPQQMPQSIPQQTAVTPANP